MSVAQGADAWRVAALTMMDPQALAKLLGGNPENAAPWIAAAARLDIAEAQVRLGRMLLAGEGVEENRPVAFAWFARAAQAGNAEAQNMLGRCCEHGWGVPHSAELAAVWYARAAEAGNAWAQYNLGHFYLDGNNVARDAAAAFHWYSRAATQGHPRAMSLVGRCCEEGWGTAPDLGEAREWYRRSAEAGYFRGAFNYATVLAADGLDADAVQWFAHALGLAPDDKRDTLIAAWRRVQRDRQASRHAPLRKPEARV
ncbi:MAG TPA: tetratricopeptide repeat protein [Rhizomicrobium sp.]|nr:tetratricopeptide repeat protein [Rhizomicrobium sp.]